MEDVESRNEVMQMLIQSGYFRARLPDLSDFDKLLGGLSWLVVVLSSGTHSISESTSSPPATPGATIAEDQQSIEWSDQILFFREGSSLGYKISLSEKLIESLLKLECPMILEPHQIQGMDWPKILPVARWFLNRISEGRHRWRRFRRQRALFEYYNSPMGDSLSHKDLDFHAVQWDETRRRSKPETRRKSWELTMDLGRIRDYMPRITELFFEGNDQAMMEEYERDPTDFEHVYMLKLVEHSRSTALQGRKLIDEQREELDAINSQRVQMLEEMKQVRNSVTSLDSNVALDELNVIMSKLRVLDRMERDEAEFKQQCKVQMRKLKQEISELSMSLSSQRTPDAANDEEDDEEMRVLESRVKSLREEKGRLTKEMVQMQKKMDQEPSAKELQQYARRFTELYQHLGKVLADVKKLYHRNNNLVQIRTQLKHEEQLLVSVQDNFHRARKNKKSQEQFIDGVFGWLTKANENMVLLDGVVSKERKSAEEVEMRLKKLEKLQKEYPIVVEELKRALSINHALQQQLNTLN